MVDSAVASAVSPARAWIYRHAAVVRITHWINVVCLTFLLLTGLQIFNAHPELDWGNTSSFDHPFVALQAERTPDGHLVGRTKILGASLDTTGVLGASAGEDGSLTRRGFPSWITLPSYQDLATGRRWHFFFAWILVINGLVFLGYGVASRHIGRDLLPTLGQLKGIGRSILDHLRFRFDHGEDARSYNVLQKLAYAGVVLVVLPVLILAGLAMSPGIDAAFPGILDLFGGRQSARTIHFICAFLLVLFVLVHVFMVLVSGVWNNIRSMITGWYAIRIGGSSHD
jgi:thiosulfate reductase cytochrome b subunit